MVLEFKKDQFRSALRLNAKKIHWLNQILEVFGYQRTGVNKTSTMVMMNQQFMVLEFKEDLFLLLTLLVHIQMITNSIIKDMLLQTIMVRLFQKTGENNTRTGVLMLNQQSTDFIKEVQFQLAPLLDAILNPMLSHQTMLQPYTTGAKIMHTGMTHGFLLSTNEDQFQLAPLSDVILVLWLTHMTMPILHQTGAIQTSTGNLITLHQLVRKTLFNFNQSQFQHAPLTNARLELLLNHSAVRSQMDIKLTTLSQISELIKK